MNEDLALKAEVESLKKVQFALRKWEDEPVSRPIMVAHQKSESWSRWIKPILRIAAVILALVLFAALTKLHIQIQDRSISFAFGNPMEQIPEVTPPELEANINPILEAKFQANNQEMNSRIKTAENKLLSALEDNNSQWKKYMQSVKVNQPPPMAVDQYITLEDLSSILESERQKVRDEYDVLVEHLIVYINGMQNENKRLIQTGFENISNTLIQNNPQFSLNANHKNY